MTSVGEALRDATARLGTDWARDEAEMLMAHALGCSRSQMLLGRMRDPAPSAFAAMIERIVFSVSTSASVTGDLSALIVIARFDW